MRNFLKNKKGEVVVESSIVLTISVIFLIVLIYMGLMIYQQTLVSVVANQTAANIAQVYSNEAKDPFTGYVDATSLNNSGMISKMKNDAYQEVIAQKAQWYSHYRLRTLKILNTGDPKVDVSIENKQGELMKTQVVVTIEDEFIMPIAGFFGNDGKMKIKATGRADCFDILDTINLGTAITGDADVIDVTENYKVKFITDRAKNTLFAEREVMQNTSFSDTNNYNTNYYKGFPIEKPVDADKAYFRGWETAGGELFTDRTVVRSNMEVYAIWKYKIMFDANGGTVSPGSKDVRKGEKIGSLPTPVKSGATFNGWFTADGKKVTPDTIVNKDMVLKAQWKYKVTFDANGGSFKNGKSDPIYVIEGQTIKSGLKSGKMPDVKHNDREFYRWEDNKKGNGNQITLDTKITKNITVYAIWKYNVTLDAAGGKVEKADKKVYPVAPGEKFDFADKKYEPTRTDCSFNGWYVNGTKYDSKKTITGDVQAVAKWNCTVTFMNEGSKVKVVTVEYGKKINTFPSVSKAGVDKGYSYTFAGWKNSSGTVVNKDTPIYSSVTVYANWTHEHSYREMPTAVVNDSQGDGCGAKQTKQRCGICGHEKTERIPGGNHNFKAACDQSKINHTFPKNIQWSYCSANFDHADDYHCFNAYYHKLCTSCGVEAGKLMELKFKNTDSGIEYIMWRPSIWCGNSDFSYVNKKGKTVIERHDAVIAYRENDKIPDVPIKTCPVGAKDYVAIAQKQINEGLMTYNPWA